MVMDWRTARHLGAGSGESYDGTRREARLPELTGGQLQAFIAVGQSGAPHKQAWRTLEAYRDGDRDTARAPEVEPQPADWESVASGSLDAQRSEFERNRPYLANGLRHRCLARAREIRLTAQLNHPHILPLLDSGEGAGLLYCIMSLVEGESLRERLRRERRLSVDDAGAEARPESADARRSKRRGAAPCEFDSRLGHRGRLAIDT